MSKKELLAIGDRVPSKEYQGEVEFEFRDRNGNLIGKLNDNL